MLLLLIYQEFLYIPPHTNTHYLLFYWVVNSYCISTHYSVYFEIFLPLKRSDALVTRICKLTSPIFDAHFQAFVQYLSSLIDCKLSKAETTSVSFKVPATLVQSPDDLDFSQKNKILSKFSFCWLWVLSCISLYADPQVAHSLVLCLITKPFTNLDL